MDRLIADEAFGLDEEKAARALAPERYIGCAAHQTEGYLERQVRPLLEQYRDRLKYSGKVDV